MVGAITIEPTGSKDIGVCDCCGRSSRRVWGLASAQGRCLAAYFVHWTLGHVPDQGANIDLIMVNGATLLRRRIATRSP